MAENKKNEGLTRRQWVKIAGGGIVVAAAAGLGGYYVTKPREEDTIHVIVETAFTGPYGWVGQHQTESVSMAVNEINEAGGVLGKELVYTAIDDELNPSVATRRVSDAIEKYNTQCIVGGASGGVNLAINEISKNKKIFYFPANMTSMSFHKAEVVGPYTAFPMVLDVCAVAVNMDYMIKNFGKKWYILTVDYVWGHGMLDQQKKWLEKFGGEVVGSDLFPLGTSDFSSMLTKAKAAKPDVMACNSGGTDQVNWIKQTQEFGMTDLMAVHVPLTSMYNALPAGVENFKDIVCGTDFWYELPSNYPGYAVAEEFRNKYESKWKSPPDSYASTPYKSLWEWAKAVNKVGTTKPEEVREALVGSEFQYYKTPEYWRECDLQSIQDWFLVKGKDPKNSKNKYDIFEVIGWGGRENPENYYPSCEDLGF